MNLEWKGRLGGAAPSYESLVSRLGETANGNLAGPEDCRGESSIRFGEDLHQRDTYFASRGSRLKLREIRGEGSELIWYHRPNESTARACQYRRLAIDDPGRVRAGLEATLGTETIVVKERRLFWWQNVRIHMDRVESLGDFIEFEAVLGGPAQMPRAEQQLASLQQWLGLHNRQAIATSYRDLMLEVEKP